MNRRDRLMIAIRNIIVNKSIVKKMVFGMIFVIMILFCILVVMCSYSEYICEFNEKHIKDCYYYTDIDQQEISETLLDDLRRKAEIEKQKYNAKEYSLLCTLKICDNIQMVAGNTQLVIGEEIYEQKEYYVNNREIFQNIRWEHSPIELALYKTDFSVFSDIVVDKYEGNWMKGTYPQEPGEIMMDTHVLDVFGAENYDDLLGKKISIYYLDENNEREILGEYCLTGIFNANILKTRESLVTTDNHMEHIYVNLLPEDETAFNINKGTIRYYFNDYKEYIKNYERIDDILKMNLQKKYATDIQGLQLTGKGMECCILYWILENIGKLLMLVAIGICLIITVSVMYIYQFYREQNSHYIKMLQNIGMQNKDIIWISSLEMLIMIAGATFFAIYLSILFMLIFNAIMQQVLDFQIVFDAKVCIISLLVSWIYFYCCFYITMKKRRYVS